MSVNETDDLTELRLWLVRLVVGFIALGLLVVLPYLWWLNVTPIDHVTPIDQQEAILGVKDFFELRNQAIKSVIASIQNFATVFGGIAILFNVYYGAKRAKALEKNAIAATENAIAATKNAEVAEQGQITERFTKAIEQLGSDNISIRLGGIYALERIAKDSVRDHWTIMEVLSAFVREKASLKEDLEAKKAEGEQQPQKLCTDIQAALTVIGQRDPEKDPQNKKLDLSNTDIRGANLREGKLQGVNLRKANLQGVNFDHANLQGAILKKANLKEASFYNTNLQGADLTKANLQEANFMEANLQGAILSNATMQKAKLWGTKLQGASLTIANLEEADLYQADLKGANLQGANFMGAKLQEVNFAESNLQGTKLQGADLTNAKNLNSQEISSAYGDSRTILPEDVVRPAHWK
ncbi:MULTISPECIES: pentapeptide repeat-containing protein [unclassified Coleofasciculus]|uniref:pentapeptide repeat-containing protein n=1 Tax=unclassified Coleofasciculus TaxID=2692782 RepID=UPI0018809F63|nr:MULTISPECIES: pentapeptide repeat-containing protein [unclassified Coleofasciculus]MBE9127259.1 pentapeptide repeat-containing protein [Coleofasciculus sp. LEGE 07081]MBE9150589.1 pentapeptide repeat-containing protein [Coleofasciculus sp. LEGE 07092]